MNLSQKSLIYRLWDFHNNTYELNRGQVTLCKLFWTTLWYLARGAGIITLLLLTATSSGGYLLEALGIVSTVQGFLMIYPWYMTVLAAILGIASWAVVITVIVGVVVGSCWVYTQIKEAFEGKFSKWRKSRQFAQELKMEMARDEELGLHNAWAKFKIAKREKLCPIIKVVDKQ